MSDPKLNGPRSEVSITNEGPDAPKTTKELLDAIFAVAKQMDEAKSDGPRHIVVTRAWAKQITGVDRPPGVYDLPDGGTMEVV